MSTASARRLVTSRSLSAFTIALLIIAGLLHLSTAYGVQLPSRGIQLSSAAAGATDKYRLFFTIPQFETLGSVRLQFCAESPLIGQPCSLPAGMDISGATLSSQTTGAGFSLGTVSGTDIILTRTAAPSGLGPFTFELSGIKNPSAAGSYFGRIQTYPTIDGTNTSNDYGGLAFTISSVVNISAVVPPYLYFCAAIAVTGTDCTTATGDYIDFGDFTSTVASVAQSQMVAGTNADTGYFIAMNGNTLTSGNNIIPALTVPDVSRPGVSQFGMNLVANNDPQVGQAPGGNGHGQPSAGYNSANSYKFNSGDTVASVGAPDEARKYTASYLTNVAKGQAPGIYVTTLTYVATAAF
jgi:hypothetical protein